MCHKLLTYNLNMLKIQCKYILFFKYLCCTFKAHSIKYITIKNIDFIVQWMKVKDMENF